MDLRPRLSIGMRDLWCNTGALGASLSIAQVPETLKFGRRVRCATETGDRELEVKNGVQHGPGKQRMYVLERRSEVCDLGATRGQSDYVTRASTFEGRMDRTAKSQKTRRPTRGYLSGFGFGFGVSTGASTTTGAVCRSWASGLKSGQRASRQQPPNQRACWLLYSTGWVRVDRASSLPRRPGAAAAAAAAADYRCRQRACCLCAFDRTSGQAAELVRGPKDPGRVRT
jgi:hypothetical protein